MLFRSSSESCIGRACVRCCVVRPGTGDISVSDSYTIGPGDGRTGEAWRESEIVILTGTNCIGIWRNRQLRRRFDRQCPGRKNGRSIATRVCYDRRLHGELCVGVTENRTIGNMESKRLNSGRIIASCRITNDDRGGEPWMCDRERRYAIMHIQIACEGALS